MLTIRYEDFLSDQGATLQRVCAFFGIDYLPRMLDVSASPEARYISQRSSSWTPDCQRRQIQTTTELGAYRADRDLRRHRADYLARVRLSLERKQARPDASLPLREWHGAAFESAH